MDKEQATWEDSKAVMSLYELRRSKAQQEFALVVAIKYNEKRFYKYNSNKSTAREYLHHLLSVWGKTVIKDEEKDEKQCLLCLNL